MRVADIDMTRPNENCPAGFRKVTASGKTMCGVQGAGCTSTTFSSHGIEYSRVCGRITGYQFGTTDAFLNYLSGVEIECAVLQSTESRQGGRLTTSLR